MKTRDKQVITSGILAISGYAILAIASWKVALGILLVTKGLSSYADMKWFDNAELLLKSLKK